MRAAVSGHLVSRTTQAHGHARSNIIAERHGAKEVNAIDAELLPSGERSRHYRSAGMRAGRAVGIVGFIGMSEDAICECCFDGAAHHLGGNYGRNLLSTVRLGKLQSRATWR